MFWVPVFTIVLIIYMLGLYLGAIRGIKFRRISRLQDKIKQAFLDQVIDKELEKTITEKYKDWRNAPSWTETVFQFVGCTPKKTDYLYKNIPMNWAVTAEMCQQGKLPWKVAEDFCDYMLSYSSKTKTERIFYERFLLRVEQELRKAGVQTFVMYIEGSSINDKRYRLRDFVREHGYGNTIVHPHFVFANIDLHSIDYKELYP